jgi:hypothetical protein
MAIYTQFTDESTIEAAYEVLGRADLVPVGIPTTSRLTLAAAGLETILFAQGLQYRADSGEFLAGTVTGLETRFQSKLLYRFEGLSLAATELNTLSVFTAGMAGDDTLIGSPFADLLYGADGADRYQAGAGNDEMYGVFGGDRYDGGTGLDRVLYGLDSGLATITAQSPSTFTVRFSAGGTDTLSDVEYADFNDRSVSLLELALGAPAAPDAIGTQVFRFAKVASGQYFYTGSRAERDQILAGQPGFRYEGPVFNAQDNWVTDFSPVYRFANLTTGGYFYTASAPERDTVLSDYPDYRYEGASFYVPSGPASGTVPVYRLANVQTGGYLFTTSAAERQYAQSLGFFRDEGVAFNAPSTIGLAQDADVGLAVDPPADGGWLF